MKGKIKNDKRRKNLIQRREMMGMMTYFKRNTMDYNNSVLLEKMQNSLTKLFQVEVEELGYKFDPRKDNHENTIELKFINNPKKTFRGQSTNKKSGEAIITYNIAHLYNELQNPRVDKRLITCKNMFKTVFHSKNKSE